MRGKRAKQIRADIYGRDFSPRFREYKRDQRGIVWSDRLRRMYKLAKRDWTRGSL